MDAIFHHNITFKCGHNETVPLRGTQDRRESYVTWAKENKACRKCRFADQAAETERAQGDLPALTGSEKQVSWATMIRFKALKALESAGVSGVKEAFAAQASAKWWIENRDRSPEDLLSSLRAVVS